MTGSWTVTTVMHDTSDLDQAVAFWSQVLDLEVVFRNETYAYMSKLSAGGPHLAFQAVDEARTSKNRLHLDIRVPDRREAEELVIALGGTRVCEVSEPGFPTWTVMADPQGNEFCVYQS